MNSPFSVFPDWCRDFAAAITVCDANGVILYMNERAGTNFEKWGGETLVGKSLFDCHNPHSREVIRSLIAEGRSNTYTIERAGVRKLIYQAPWYNDGKVAGVVELAIELPAEMPHYVRGG